VELVSVEPVSLYWLFGMLLFADEFGIGEFEVLECFVE